jgi:twitching motility protein PilT
MRLHGEIVRLEGYPAIENDAMTAMLKAIMPPRNRQEFADTWDTDFAYEIDGVARFRCNALRDRRGAAGVFRVIPSNVVTADQLGLSQEVQNLCFLSKGLVLVTGPTGSGKSTTLCALVDLVNRMRNDHVITIEDPIEFTHKSKKCMITQRQVGLHTQSFKAALRAALREDPDIILVGELRDLETVSIAIETAETGHLVFGTLHTTTAASTVDRIIDQFSADRQEQIRVMLSESLKGVIAQTLCRKIGGGRVAAREILLAIPAVSNLIREGKTFQIPSVIQTSRRLGMVTLNDALVELVDTKQVEPREAYVRAQDKTGLLMLLKSHGQDVSFIEVDETAGGSKAGASPAVKAPPPPARAKK